MINRLCENWDTPIFSTSNHTYLRDLWFFRFLFAKYSLHSKNRFLNPFGFWKIFLFRSTHIIFLSKPSFGLTNPKWYNTWVMKIFLGISFKKCFRCTSYRVSSPTPSVSFLYLHMRSLLEEPHLAVRLVTFSFFFCDFRHLSCASITCNWAAILICWCQRLGE